MSVQREGRRKTAEVYALHHSPFSPFWYPSSRNKPPPQSQSRSKPQRQDMDAKTRALRAIDTARQGLMISHQNISEPASQKAAQASLTVSDGCDKSQRASKERRRRHSRSPMKVTMVLRSSPVSSSASSTRPSCASISVTVA